MWGMPRLASAEKAYLTSRSLAFGVHSVEARPALRDAVHAFAYRYGDSWRVVYVGRQADHMIDKAIGYGATHRLVALSDADEGVLIDELKPPLNGGGWPLS